MTKRQRPQRPQSPKPNRHVQRVQNLRRSTAARPHKMHRDDLEIRKYGIRAILKNEG